MEPQPIPEPDEPCRAADLDLPFRYRKVKYLAVVYREPGYDAVVLCTKHPCAPVAAGARRKGMWEWLEAPAVPGLQAFVEGLLESAL